MAKAKKTSVRAPVPVTLTGEVWRPPPGSQILTGSAGQGLPGGVGKPRYGVWAAAFLVVVLGAWWLGRSLSGPDSTARDGGAGSEASSSIFLIPSGHSLPGGPEVGAASGPSPGFPSSAGVVIALASPTEGSGRPGLPRVSPRPPEQPRIPPRITPRVDPSGENPYPPDQAAGSPVDQEPPVLTGLAPAMASQVVTATAVIASPALVAALPPMDRPDAEPQPPKAKASPSPAGKHGDRKESPGLPVALPEPAAPVAAPEEQGAEAGLTQPGPATPTSPSIATPSAASPSVASPAVPAEASSEPPSERGVPPADAAVRPSGAVPVALPVPGAAQEPTPLELPPLLAEPPAPPSPPPARSWREELDGPLTPDFTRGWRVAAEPSRPAAPRVALPHAPAGRPAQVSAFRPPSRASAVPPLVSPSPSPPPAPVVSRWARLAAQAGSPGRTGDDELAGPVVPALNRGGAHPRPVARPEVPPVVARVPSDPALSAVSCGAATGIPVLARAGGVLLGLRSVLEPAGWSLTWVDRQTGVRGIGPGGRTLTLVPGRRQATLAGKTIRLPMAPVLSAEGRLFVPLDLLEQIMPGRVALIRDPAAPQGWVVSLDPSAAIPPSREPAVPPAFAPAPPVSGAPRSPAFIHQGKPMVELRPVLEADGWSVHWGGPRGGAVCRKGPGQLLIVVPGNPFVRWNGTTLESCPPPMQRRGKLFVSADVLATVLGPPASGG